MTVQYQVNGAVVTVTIDRPQARNAVDAATAEELATCFRRFAADDRLSVAVLTGAGNTFCAGFDLKAVAAGDPNRLFPLIDLGTIRLPRVIGHGRAMDLILTGRPVQAGEAFEIGLVNRLVEPGTALDAAQELARQLAELPQRALRADRRSLLRQWSLSLDEAMTAEFRGGMEVIASGEAQEGARRFAEGSGRHGS